MLINCVKYFLRKKVSLIYGLGCNIDGMVRIIKPCSFGTPEIYRRFSQKILKTDIIVITTKYLKTNSWISDHTSLYTSIVDLSEKSIIDHIAEQLNNVDRKVKKIHILASASEFDQLLPIASELMTIFIDKEDIRSNSAIGVDKVFMKKIARKTRRYDVDLMFADIYPLSTHQLPIRRLSAAYIKAIRKKYEARGFRKSIKTAISHP